VGTGALAVCFRPSAKRDLPVVLVVTGGFVDGEDRCLLDEPGDGAGNPCRPSVLTVADTHPPITSVTTSTTGAIA
jgi:hypothetical protein